MWRLGLTVLIFSAVHGLAGARGPDWRPERLLGSERLELAAVRSIVLPEGAGAELQAAAKDLAELWDRRMEGEGLAEIGSTDRAGVDLSIQAWPRTPGGGRPYPKNALVLERVSGSEARLGGFLIERERTRVFVRSADEDGLANGLYALADDLLGARWYWPGDLGFEWVGEPPRFFAEALWREVPAFEQRTLRPVGVSYEHRNRVNRPFVFGHSFANSFGPEQFEESPEAFALVQGKRRKPRGSRKHDANPDFTSPEAVRIAAEAARGHFSAKPESRSFSLSINDNTVFDESSHTEAAVTPLEYFRGRPNYTDLVFGFMNEVAEEVFGTEGSGTLAEASRYAGERYLTSLAYYWTEQSPSFPIHPQVMPVLTSDRAQWHDPAYRAQDKALIERWAASGADRIATWDYYFGAPYPYPRHFNQWMVESIRFLNTQGVDVFFSQLPSMWGHDGPKAWLAARLLWDPRQDADALLAEFYGEFFGPAAEAVRGFYELAESHRNANAGTAEWIKYYRDEGAISWWTPEVLAEMRDRLDEAESAVDPGSRYAGRVAVVSEAFELTELYAAFHRARLALLRQVWADAVRPEAGSAAATRFLEARARFRERARDLVKQPYHGAYRHFLTIKQTDPLPLWIGRGAERLPEDLPEALAGETSRYAETLEVARAWGGDAEGVKAMLEDSRLRHSPLGPVKANFLGPDLPVVPGWFYDYRPAERFAVTAADKVAGESAGLRIVGADMVSVFRDVPVIGGKSYLLEAEMAWQVSPDNRTQLKLTWSDRNGRTLRIDLPLQLPNGDSGETRRISLPLKAPPGAYDLRVHFVVSRQYAGDYFELRKVDFGLVR